MTSRRVSHLRSENHMFRKFINGLFIVAVGGTGQFAAASEGRPGDQSLEAGQATASCNRKCLGRKTGERQAKLHRIGWEAAIRDLDITGDQKRQILELSTRIE